MSILSKPLNEFSFQELDELRKIVNSPNFNKRQTETFAESQNFYLTKYEKAKAAREKTALNRKAELPAIQAFIKNNLKIGDFLRFKNTKGSGIREVSKIFSDSILGLVVQRLKDGVPYYTSYSAENGIENIQEYFDKSSNTWKDRKWIIQTGNSITNE